MIANTPAKRRPRFPAIPRLAWLFLLWLHAVLPAAAHEGHAPLPTKGAQVDLAKGTVVLSAEAHRTLGITTEKIELQPVDETVLAYATIVPQWQRHYFITSPIAGRITALHAKPGETVQRGQVLAEVHSLELEDVQLELLTAQNNAALSDKTLARIEGLARANVVPARELTEVKAKHRENQSSLEIAISKLKSFGVSHEQINRLLEHNEPIRSLPLASGIDGVVTHSDLAVGRVIEPREHLFEVMDLAKVSVRIDVLEADLHKVAIGQPLRLSLTSFPDVEFETTVQVKERYLDPGTHLGRVWGELVNSLGGDRQILPGMYGEARVVVSEPTKRLTVSPRAVFTNGTETYVLVEEAATSRAYEYRKRNIQIGLRTRDRVEIVSGEVFPGDQVVATGGHLLSNYFFQEVLRPSSEAQRNMGLRLAAVEKQVVEEILEVDGAVDLPPDRRAFASSQVAGKIQTILVDRGQEVTQGEVIAEVASVQLQQIQLELLRAHVDTELLEDALARYRKLDRSQVISLTQVQQTESRLAEAKYRRQNARRNLATMGLSEQQLESLIQDKKLVDLLPIRAPVDGVIVNFDQALGQAIDAEQPLFEVHDLSTVWVRAYLSERDVSSIGIGTPARVRLVAEPDGMVRGHVVRNASALEPGNRTLSVWVELEETPPSVANGMLARVAFTLRRSEPSLAVPRAAIVRQGTRGFVFVRRPDGSFERRSVRTGRADDRAIEVQAGLKPGEMVAVEGAAHLQTAFASIR